MKLQTFFNKQRKPLNTLSNKLLLSLKVSGHSMLPHILDGEAVLVSGIPYLFKNPKINDIVAFEIEKQIFLKRVLKISNGKYFVRGDNKNDSFDSRKFGYILKSQILGKVIYKFK